MRLPQPPPEPSLADIVRITALEEDLRDAVGDAIVRYLPWDDIRRRHKPADARAVWAAVRGWRKLQSVPLPIHDKRGVPFEVSPPAQYLLNALLEIEASARDPLGLAGARDVAAASREQMTEALADESIESSLLEGAATTRRAATALIRSGRSPRTLGEKMVLNNYRTMSELEHLVDEELTPELVCHLHRLITADTLDDPADEGRLQTPGEVRVTVRSVGDDTLLHDPPEAGELPERLARLCDFANDVDPGVPYVFRAMLLHFQLAYDHPFVDGNGRTARALFYWSILKDDYWLFRYLAISKSLRKRRQSYSRSFVHSDQNSDVTYFLLGQVQAVLEALEDMRRRVARHRERVGRSRRALSGWPQFNHRQRTIIAEALKGQGPEFRTRGHADRFGVTGQTALTDLRKLQRLGFLEARREGRTLVFVPVADLAARVADGPEGQPAGGSG